MIAGKPDADSRWCDPFDPEPEWKIERVRWDQHRIHSLVRNGQIAARDQRSQIDGVENEITATQPHFNDVHGLRSDTEARRDMGECQRHRLNADGCAREQKREAPDHRGEGQGGCR